MRGKGGGEQRRQRRDRAVHQSGESRLHVLQHEHAPPCLVLFGAHIGAQNFAGQLDREFFVALFFLREVAEEEKGHEKLAVKLTGERSEENTSELQSQSILLCSHLLGATNTHTHIMSLFARLS